MDKNTALYLIAALLFGFIGGFLLANSMNRSEMSALRAQAVQPAAVNSNTVSTAPDTAEPSLSDDEIRAKLAEADKNPTNFQFQKDLGTALYKYAAMKQLPGLLPETVRILEQAESLNGKDFDVLVALGNAHFDLGFQNQDGAQFRKARDLYTRALAVRPDDTDVLTDTAITWYLQPSPDYAKAAGALEKISAANPSHTRSMRFLAQTYIKMGRMPDAQKVLDRIKAVDPNDDAIPEITKQIAAGTGNSK